jgi:hypothetical protein
MSLKINKHRQDALSLLSASIVFFATAQIGGWGVSLLSFGISQYIALTILATSIMTASIINFFMKGEIPPQSQDATFFSRPLSYTVTGSASVVFLFLLGIAFAKDDLSWDGNVYHLPTIGLWIQKGFIYWIDKPFHSVELMNGYPKGAELFVYLLCMATKSSNLANALNLFFLPLGVFGIALLGQTIGASKRAAWCAASLYILIPVTICQSVSTFIDSAYASCAIATFALFTHYLHRNMSRLDAIIMGASLGLTISIKQPGLLLLSLVIFIWTLRLFIKRAPFNQQSITTIILVAATSMIIGGGWYLRNFITAGSPIYPAGLSIAGHVLLPGKTIADMLAVSGNMPEFMSSWTASQRIAFTWAQGLSAYPYSIVGVDARLGGLGMAWLLGMLPSIPMAFAYMRRETFLAKYSFGCVVFFVSLAFVLQPMNWWARYTVWIYGAGLPAFALLLDQWKIRWIRIWACLILLIVTCECAASLMYTVRFKGLLPTQEIAANSDNTRKLLPMFPELSNKFKSVLESAKNIAIGPLSGENCQLTGNLVMPFGFRKIEAITTDIDAVSIKQLKVGGFDFIIWDKHYGLIPALKQNTKIVAESSRFYLLGITNQVSQ